MRNEKIILQYIKVGNQANIFAKLFKDTYCEAIKIARNMSYGRIELRKDVEKIIQFQIMLMKGFG